YYKFPMPDNCWRGVTITKGEARVFPLVDSGIRFASFEPLLGEIQMKGCPFDWIILGSLTGPGSKKYQPKVEWIENILRQADEYNVPVFMKNSLSKIWNKPLCQKFPTTKGDK
ncbi:MAG: DUF5131 family protein, partial [Candidatus Omnitrophica bacterium]|nr:DUF5131 family protein [Candidatus Omnitrophota bacterium]